MNLISIMDENNCKGNEKNIYSKLLENRIIFVTGEINDSLSNKIIAELLYLDSVSNDDIYLYINSPGGSVYCGLAIYDTMNFIKSDVCTVGMGLVASMSALLLSSGTIGKRFVLKNACIMIHQIMSSSEGKINDLKNSFERISMLQDRVNNILAKNTLQTAKKIKCDIKNEFYMTAEETLNYGMVDKII